MVTFFGIGIAAPWVLAALALLPVIYLLLRLMPTRPQSVSFPPMRLLLDLKKQEETPVRSPWWQTLMRLLAAAAIIVALADAILRPNTDTLLRSGPVWVLVDNTWAAASDWSERMERLTQIVDTAQSSERPVLLIGTADGIQQTSGAVTPGVARQRAAALAPRPWSADRLAFETFLAEQAEASAPARIYWLSDGNEGANGAQFAQHLNEIAPDADVVVYRSLAGLPLSIVSAENEAEAVRLQVARADAFRTPAGAIRALDLRGNLLGEAEFAFEDGAVETTAVLDLPLELRNEVARLEIAGERSAGAVFLVDEQWQRRRVGIVAGTTTDEAQPLLSSEYYLRRAVGPFSSILEQRSPDMAEGINELTDDGASILFLADLASIADRPATELLEWIANGGMVVRFAVSGLHQATDGLLPVTLRAGARDLGGTLTWSEPQSVGDFSSSGPFAGIEVPQDIVVSRQVLAQPASDLIEKTWAQLSDGTPLVTGERIGAGWLVLFHVPADTSWSNLALSGTFVEMLNRLIQMSRSAVVDRGQAGSTDTLQQAETLPPLRLLDGYGQFGTQYPDAEPLPVNAPLDILAGITHPPGVYGSDSGFRAVNVHQGAAPLAPLELGELGSRAQIETYERASSQSLAPALFLIALLILIADGLIVLVLSGGLRLRPAAASVGAFVIFAAAFSSFSLEPAHAQESVTPSFAVSETRLAYVLTGNLEVDQVSERGLFGLSEFLRLKTALEPGEPIGVDVSSDELVFYPLLYWPIDPTMLQPDAATLSRVETYMKSGGTVLFDTRDSLEGVSFSAIGSPAGDWLREMLKEVDVPPLEPVPLDHVLTKTFYLLSEFPGRYPEGELWIEALEAVGATERPVRSSDGVSPILITGNDLAGAWAINAERRPMFPTIPNDSFQREIAYRVGVNIVMYTLTGNYKADQVHVPALLERLGQ